MMGIGERKRNILLIISIASFVLGIIYIFPKIINIDSTHIDFRYIWMSGKLWGEGISPYSENLSILAKEYINNDTFLMTWLYPPTWVVLSWPLSLLNLDYAGLVWKILSLLFLYSGAFLTGLSLPFSRNITKITVVFFCLAYISLMQASSIAISIGQTTPLIFLGMSFLVSGVLQKNDKYKTVGLVILALKPQIGFYFFLASFFCKNLRKNALFAIIINVILCIPSLLSIGIYESIWGFIKNLTSYNGQNVNDIVELSGLRNILFYFNHMEISSSQSILLGLIALIVSLIVCGKLGILDEKVSIGLSGIWAFLFISLHSYDFIVVFALFPLFMHETTYRIKLLSFLIFMVLLRADNLANLTGIMHGSVRYSVGSLTGSLCFAVLAVIMIFNYRNIKKTSNTNMSSE